MLVCAVCWHSGGLIGEEAGRDDASLADDLLQGEGERARARARAPSAPLSGGVAGAGRPHVINLGGVFVCCVCITRRKYFVSHPDNPQYNTGLICDSHALSALPLPLHFLGFMGSCVYPSRFLRQAVLFSASVGWCVHTSTKQTVV